MDTEKYFNRELSWIEFNARVLHEAMDETNPLLERLKFAGIVTSNFDEFFMVRVAGLLEGDEALSNEVYRKSFALMERGDRYFAEILVPELEKSGGRRVQPVVLSETQRGYLRKIFDCELLPLLTPLAIREENLLPRLINLRLYRIFQLTPESAPGPVFYSLVEVPQNYPRMIILPSAEIGYAFILLEDVISLFGRDLFPGYQILEQGLMRVTRAAELSLDEEKDEDFAKVMTAALLLRQRSDIVRLEIAACDEMVHFLTQKFNVSQEKIYRHSGWFDMKTISQLASQPGFDRLKLPAWVPKNVPDFERNRSVWEVLKQKDVLVQHPYQSFNAFLHFLREAAGDPEVLAIKQTLYRVAETSGVTEALEYAAKNGKQVVVLIELKARFEEEQNIEWANRLMDAGATVLYGVAGLKTHAKACLVIRREADGVKRYLHLSTGNYNEKTAQIYSDIGFFTSNDDLGRDVSAFFNVITGYSNPTGFSKIIISPYGLRRKLARLILREAARSQKENPGFIMAKMNALVDPEIIDALYRASQAGVQIKLNVRGVCCLKPGVKGMSENIEVASIVDMFLEHSRVFYFSNGGDEEIYLSSADWMPRNFDRRLEIMFPVENPEIKNDLIGLMKSYFKDNTKTWQLFSDGQYRKKETRESKKFRVQEYLCQTAAENEANLRRTLWDDLKPQKPKAGLNKQGVPSSKIQVSPPALPQ